MAGETPKKFAVVASAAGLSTWAIDMAATQIGLPSMQADLAVSVIASQWILNLTLMILAGVVTVGGALGDRLGRLRLFRAGLTLIMAGALVSFGGGLLSAFGVVLSGRALQGLGAALFIPASIALLVDVFPAAERGAAQGRMMMISMFITAFAPTVIGLVIQFVSWPFTYLFTVASAITTLLLLGKVSYAQRKAPASPFDYLGSILVLLTISLLTIGIMQIGVLGMASPVVLGLFGSSLVLGVVLVVVSLRKAHPLIQFRVMRIRSVAIAVFVSLMRFLPIVLLGAFLARYVQQVLGLSPTATGMLLILPVLAQVSVAPIAGKMLDTTGPRRPVAVGVGLLSVGLILSAVGFPAQNIWLIVIGTVLASAGFSFTNPVQIAALGDTPLDQRGMLAGIFPLAGNFGTALWVALLTAGLGSLMHSFMASSPGAAEAAAQASALGKLAWLGLPAMLVTLWVAMRLPAQPAKSDAPPVAARSN